MLEILDRKTRESASDFARRVLEYNIVHLKLLPGEQLQEKELAEQISVSRTPVREAILELKRRNILVVYPQRGTFVSFLEEKRGEDIRYLRFVFEPRLAEEACAVRDGRLVAELRGIIYAQKPALSCDPDRFLQLDDRFHETIYRAQGREDLYQIVKLHSIHFDRVRRLSYQLSSAESLVFEHEAIAMAIEAGDAPNARKVYERHLTRAIADHEALKVLYPQYYAPMR
jgi:DNA-binding GntR family transcriptional regulator